MNAEPRSAKPGRPPIHPDELSPILDAVLRLATRQSSQLASMRQIAAEAGVSPGRLQHHFGSRDELISRAFRTHLLRVTDELERLRTSPGTASERMAKVINEVAAHYSWQRTSVWVDLLARGVGSEEYRGAVRVIDDAWYRVFYELIREGALTGEFNTAGTPEQCARLLVSVVDGLAILIIRDGESWIDEAAELRHEVFAVAVSAVLGRTFAVEG